MSRRPTPDMSQPERSTQHNGPTPTDERPPPIGVMATAAHYAVWAALYCAALPAAALLWADGPWADGPNDPGGVALACVAAGLIGWGIYAVDRVKLRGAFEPNDRANQPSRVRSLAPRVRAIRIGAWACIAISTALCAAIAIECVLYPVLALGVVLIYGHRAGGRLKDSPSLKNLVVAGGLTGLAAGLSGLFLRFEQPWPHLATHASMVIAFVGNIAADAMVCDLDDVPGDRANGTRSLPVVIGRTPAAWLAATIALAASLAAWSVEPAIGVGAACLLVVWPVSTAALAMGAARFDRRVRDLIDARLAGLVLACVVIEHAALGA